MTPVMERCPCSWPIAECLEHSAPTATSAPVDDTDGLAQPISGRVILVVVGLLVFDAAVVVGVVKAVEWLLGLLR
jgi:hypothetical protein